MFVGHYGVGYWVPYTHSLVATAVWFALAFALEAILLAAGLGLYLRATAAASAAGRYGMPIFAVVLLGSQATVFFGAPPPSPEAAAVTGLAAYFAFAGVAGWLERKRV